MSLRVMCLGVVVEVLLKMVVVLSSTRETFTCGSTFAFTFTFAIWVTFAFAMLWWSL